MQARLPGLQNAALRDLRRSSLGWDTWSYLMRKSLPLAVLFGWLFLEAPVSAYLDPGSGSILLQVLLGGFAAVGVIVKLYWNRWTS